MANSSPAQIAKLVRVTLLGAFQVERDAQTIHLPTRKVESLLAYLALHPEPHAREKLAALCWGDSTDELARRSLRTALFSLRQELGNDLLLADRETVQLNPDFPIWVDAREIADCRLQIADSEIENLKLKIENYHDLLPDFYDDWILPEREQLRAIYIDALLHLAQHHRAKSEYARAIELAQKVLTHDPANEKADQHIIFCHAATGDRIGALKQFDECAKMLREELGVEPSPETIALRDQIEQALSGARSREAMFTNLPHPLTSFVGRANELAEIKRLLDLDLPGFGNLEGLRGTRLLTLTGSGGCGKTRLVIQFATELANANRFKNGVWWVDLSALTDGARVPQSLAAVFGLRESSDIPIIPLLINYLRAKELLLVVDNCEHLIEACAHLIETLLSACPTLKILATSREALNLAGEVVWRVPSLAVPDAANLPPLDQLAQYDALQLFVQRAQAVAPNWKLNGNARAVAQICARLDGMPLALELAAARVKGLSVEEIAQRLDHRFQLLASGQRTALPRQQTLRATIDWSFDLLSENERALFRRLAVFAGGWTLNAVEEICTDESLATSHVLDLLLRLIDKSLVVVAEQSGATRYHFLETIREYAREKLAQAGEAEKLYRRHLDWFVQFAIEADAKLRTPEMKRWFKQLDAEIDNCRTALAWAFENGQGAAGAQLNAALVYYFFVRNHYREAKSWSETAEALTRDAPAVIRAEALFALGMAVADVGENARAEEIWRQALSLYRDLENRMRIGRVLNLLGVVSNRLGKLDQAELYFQEALTLCRAMGDKWGITHALQNFDAFAERAGDFARAKAINEEGLRLSEELGDERMITRRFVDLGRIACAQGDLKQADALLKRAISTLWRMKEMFSLHQALETFALVLVAQGQPRRAAQILGAIESGRAELGVILSEERRAELEQIIQPIRAQLGDDGFARAFEEGRAMKLENIVEDVLNDGA
ncbi:MAG: tetratricopeptide repeat protein [Chloroflexi bacterium]|nr:tetratricopeptide repeat protein [Chloroflexota bacterium]